MPTDGKQSEVLFQQILDAAHSADFAPSRQAVGLRYQAAVSFMMMRHSIVSVCGWRS